VANRGRGQNDELGSEGLVQAALISSRPKYSALHRIRGRTCFSGTMTLCRELARRQRMSGTASAAVVIGDSANDMLCAREAAVTAILFRPTTALGG
jgi:hypothetical protein